MQNVEIKFELRDPEAARMQCRLGGAARIGILRQVDTCYRLPEGRLKRRESAGEPVEWIFYHRADVARPRLSSFTILSDEQARTRWGVLGLVPWRVVTKARELWLDGNVRLHLDEVEGLGRFLEIEALVGPSTDPMTCHERIRTWRDRLAPALGEPVSAAYADLVDSPPEESDRR
ncbi:MAG: class IV adenylate cyclase [Phycisphaeraceae bacterium]|nr:class IV adenylate cyclase [Phycisphaeraceae bacterium]